MAAGSKKRGLAALVWLASRPARFGPEPAAAQMFPTETKRLLFAKVFCGFCLIQA